MTSAFTIQQSTVDANLKGLELYLKSHHKTHLASTIANALSPNPVDEQGRVSLAITSENITRIANIVDDEHLGLKIVCLVDLNHLPLYRTLQHSAAILHRDGQKIPLPILTNMISRYFTVLSEVAHVRIEEHSDFIRLYLQPNLPELVSFHQIDGMAMAIHRLLNAFYQISPSALSFEHSKAKDNLDIYLQHFNLLPEFNQPENYIEYSTKNMVAALSESSVTMISSVQALLDKEFPNASYTERCIHILKCIISFGEPTREHVASILNISISSLQRRLKQESTSFQALLLQVRKQLAHEFLVEQKRGTTDTAFLLGYQSSSQFFKAFKKWFGQTPTQFQKSHLD